MGGRRRPQHALPTDHVGRVAVVLAVVVIGFGVVRATVDAASLEPDSRFPGMSEAMATVIPDAAAQLDRGPTYLVVYDDFHGAGLGMVAVVNELERLGFDARAPVGWEVLVGRHRVTAAATPALTYVTGEAIERWRSRPGVVELAHYEPSPRAARELTALQADLRAGLNASAPHLAWMVDGNLFGLSVAPDLPHFLQDGADRAMRLAVPTSIFLQGD